MPAYPAIVEAHNEPLLGDNLYNLSINYKWRRLVAELLQPLANSSFWSGSDPDIDDSVFNAAVLIEDLYTAEATGVTQSYAEFKQIVPSYTDGGSSVAGTNIRSWNNFAEFGTSFVTAQDGTNFTILPGLYHFYGTFAAYASARSRAVLYNTSGTLNPILGVSSFFQSVSPRSGGNAIIDDIARLIVSTQYQIHHYTQSAIAGNGLGLGVNDGYAQIFVNLRITRIGD